MIRRNPGGIKGLCATRDSWAISTNNGDLVGWVDTLRALRRLFSALATFSTAAGLREQSLDPGTVDEIAGSAEDAQEEEVEEDAFWWLANARIETHCV
jgi:hypothetical protein